WLASRRTPHHPLTPPREPCPRNTSRQLPGTNMKNLWPFKAKSDGNTLADHRGLEILSGSASDSGGDSRSPHADHLPTNESAPSSHEPSAQDSDRDAN